MSITSLGADWKQRAAGSSPRNRLFIGGQWQDAASGETFETIAPRDGSVITHVAAGDTEDVDRAVVAARRAFEEGPWPKMSPRVRKQVMMRWADLVEEHAEELALLESLDVGKPISLAIAGDAAGVASTLRWYAEAADKVYGEIAPTGDETLALITREPLGVIGAVVPWNYPMVISAWKIAPALIAGNAVIVKPAEQSPLSMLRLAELGQQAGLPDGILNVVTGFGPTAGQALGRHRGVDKIVFTGSGPVGRKFQVYAGESNGKAVQIEGGGKSPHLVLPDVEDLERVAASITRGFCYNTGQTCSAGTRVLVHRDMRDDLLTAISAETAAFAPGDPLEEKTRMGPIVDGAQLDRVLSYLDIATSDGAEVVIGGSRVRHETGGFFIEPTVLAGLPGTSRVIREEIFGPVVAVETFRDVDEGIRMANDTEYGLAAAVWSDALAAHKVARRLQAGTVWINTYAATDVMTPFGGFGASGYGRDKSLHALDEYTGLKTTWVHLS